jgi:phenylalanine-4-hydroxylase
MPSLDELRQRHPEIRPDFTIDQHWERYGAAEHGTWPNTSWNTSGSSM